MFVNRRLLPSPGGIGLYFVSPGLLLICLTVAHAQASRTLSALAYVERGNQWMDKGEWERAIADFNLTIATDPRAAVGYNNRGVARQAKSDP